MRCSCHILRSFHSPESVAPVAPVAPSISLTSLVARYPWPSYSICGESEFQEIDETIKTLEGLYTEAASYVSIWLYLWNGGWIGWIGRIERIGRIKCSLMRVVLGLWRSTMALTALELQSIAAFKEWRLSRIELNAFGIGRGTRFQGCFKTPALA